jgi:hypothetical protein
MTYFQSFRTNKFKNKKTVFGGRLYASKLESSVAADLELAKKATNPAERVIEVIPQFPIDFYILPSRVMTTQYQNGARKVFRYYVDFKVVYADGHEELVEAKGIKTDIWRMKWLFTEEVYQREHPGVELKIIK